MIGHGTLRRAKLEPLRQAGTVYTAFLESFQSRTPDDETHWTYITDEYGPCLSEGTSTDWVTEYWRRLGGGSLASARHALRSTTTHVSECDLFWVVGASEIDLADPAPSKTIWPREPLEPVPFMDAIYLCEHPQGRLRERDGQRCRVYAVQERSAGKGRRVPARYGIRFPNDNTYWVVPAREIALAPAYKP